ncbi:hypothetical protein CR513_28846, partial [Mucuna pruriens]
MRLVVFFLNAPPSHDCAPLELRALSLTSSACLFAGALRGVDTLVAKGAWVDQSSARDFIMVAPFEERRVCHTALVDEDDFIFMYEAVFKDLGISLPFDFFFAEVLGTLGIAPSQLHPNSWAILWAFEIICRAISIKPMTPLLFSFYTARISQGATWVSLVTMYRMNLFCLMPLSLWTGNTSLSTGACQTGYRGLSSGDLNAEDQVSWGILNQLPHCVNCKKVVVAYFAADPSSYLIAIFKKLGYELSAMIHDDGCFSSRFEHLSNN